MDNQLKLKIYDFAKHVFVPKLISGWDEKTLEDYAKEQYFNAYFSEGLDDLDSFDEDSVIEDVVDYFGDMADEYTLYKENKFTDEEIKEMIGEGPWAEMQELQQI